MVLNPRTLFELLVLSAVFPFSVRVLGDEGRKSWGALVVTLAGTSKLSEYFSWTCRTIGNSEGILDMLVFHEGNTKLKDVNCARNVKFVDLGENGFSKLVVSDILGKSNSTSETNRGILTGMLTEVIKNVPRYLVEIKPMTGSLFKDWLTEYSHWSYTDPDIIWANMNKWADFKEDADSFDIVTVAKDFDAGRLFIRGQFALHKNTEKVNMLWKQLDFFSPDSFAARLGSAARMLKELKSPDEVFYRNFNSAEGWYSEVVFKSGVSVKILGRGLDDFNQDPVMLLGGVMMRCKVEWLHLCVQELKHKAYNVSTLKLPALEEVNVETFYHPTQCMMQWLPKELRFCVGTPVYSKDVALGKGDTSNNNNNNAKEIRLTRLGEAFNRGGGKGDWHANDEKKAHRQTKFASFFHFRHWDDFASVGKSTDWGTDVDTDNFLGCMILWLRPDLVMAFENCATAIPKMTAEGTAQRPRAKGIAPQAADRGIAVIGGDKGADKDMQGNLKVPMRGVASAVAGVVGVGGGNGAGAPIIGGKRMAKRKPRPGKAKPGPSGAEGGGDVRDAGEVRRPRVRPASKGEGAEGGRGGGDAEGPRRKAGPGLRKRKPKPAPDAIDAPDVIPMRRQ